jgi:hypothetical protein
MSGDPIEAEAIRALVELRGAATCMAHAWEAVEDAASAIASAANAWERAGNAWAEAGNATALRNGG